MKQIIFTLVLLLAISMLKAQITDFNLSSDVAKKCTAFSEFNVDIEGYKKKIYFYYENPVIDTLFIEDSVKIMNENNPCLVIDTVVKLPYFELTKGKIYIVGPKGELYNKKPFDNVVAVLPFYQAMDGENYEYDCEQYQMVFFGYSWNFFEQASLKPGVTSNHFFLESKTFVEENNQHLLKVERDGKWGLMDFDGKMIVEIEYSNIEFAKKNKIRLFNNGLLVKIIRAY